MFHEIPLRRDTAILALAARRTLIAAWLCACAEGEASSAGATSAAATRDGELPASVAGVPVPDSAFARAAAELAFAVSPEFLSNHLMRTYVFGSLLLEAEGRAHDPELTFAAVMLHDLGLVEQYMSPDRRFELDGADAAARFLSEHGRSAEQVELVWQAVALHTSGEIATRLRPEIALVALGAAADAVGAGVGELAAADVEALLQAYPRLGFKEAAVRGIIDQCERKPFAYALHPWVEVGRRHIDGFSVPTVEDLIRAAPFAD